MVRPPLPQVAMEIIKKTHLPLSRRRRPNRCLDTLRRRVQQEPLGDRGRKRDPLYHPPPPTLTGPSSAVEPGRPGRPPGGAWGEVTTQTPGP